MLPRAWTSVPPSVSLPSLTGANPGCSAKADTDAIAFPSSLETKTTRRPPLTSGSAAKVAATRWLNAFTNRRRAGPGTPRRRNDLVAQFARALATSQCYGKGAASRTMSTPSASSNDLGMIVVSIAFACGASASGGRRLATATSRPLQANMRARV